MLFQAYHGVTAADHQAYFNKWSSQGYRMISLSVYGDPGNALYAAVWVQRAGPAWQAIHGVNAADYQSFFSKWSAAGYYPVLVSATGQSNDAVFASVFEQGNPGPWSAQHGMTLAEFAIANTVAFNNGQMIRSFSIYGTLLDRRYAAIWHPNPSYVKWHVHSTDLGSAAYQATFNAETQLPGVYLNAYRPAYVAVASDATYCSVFKDDFVGPWAACHGLSGSDYQTFFTQQTAAGNYPIFVQGGGTTAAPIYAAVFAKQDVPDTRQWTVTGAPLSALAPVDQAVQIFMQSNGVRAAQVAIAKNGAMKASRGYSWAEPAYRVTQPTDRFLLASCSKMFCEAAIQSLYDSGKLQPSTKVYPLLGFSGPADPRSDTITVQQLLDHQGGYNDGRNPNLPATPLDPTYSMRQIGQALGHVVTNKLDIAHYMYGQPLQFAPGTGTAYSNYGYLLLGAVVEKVTGMSYHAYLAQALLQPAGISEVEVFSTRAAGRTAHQAIAEDERFGQDPLDLASTSLIPYVYGGDGEINEIGDPNDGTAASAEALAQFAHTHAAYGNGPRAPSGRSGGTPGASTWVESRGDGVDWAYTVNTADWPPTNGKAAATTTKGNQALKTTAFTLTVAAGGTAGFQSSGHLLVDTTANRTQLVAYTGINAGANAFTGCTAPANAGTASDGGNVVQAATVIGTPALSQTPFTLKVSKNGTQGFARTGMLLVTNGANAQQVIRYTGLGTDAFEGCAALLSGAGSASASTAVTQATLVASIDTLLNSISLA